MTCSFADWVATVTMVVHAALMTYLIISVAAKISNRRVREAVLEEVAKEFDRRSVYADGTKSGGWYEVDEPASIVRSMKERLK